MDYFLDALWEKIVVVGIFLADSFDALVTPFHFLGPGMIIFLLAVLSVLITKGLNRMIITKRYVRLEKEFKHWHNVRATATAYEDREKGKAMAKNIDKAELNKVYYDYFFEGLMLGLIRKIIPIFFMFAYINEYFKPQRLTEIFGRGYVFEFPSSSGEPVLVGTVFWYIMSLLTAYLAWAIIKKCLAILKKNDLLPTEPAAENV
jgi:hypothetical protein